MTADAWFLRPFPTAPGSTTTKTPAPVAGVCSAYPLALVTRAVQGHVAHHTLTARDASGRAKGT